MKQSLLQSVSYTESYPYDTATFTSATVTQPSGSAIGFTGGADIGYYFSRSVGVGGVVRYSGATVSLAGSGGPVSLTAGGFQVGAGL